MDVGRVWKCSVSIKPLVKRIWTQKTLREYKSWNNEFAPSRTDLLLVMCRTYNKAKKSSKEWGSFEEVKKLKHMLPDLKSGFSSMSASLLMSSCRFSSSCNKTWNSRLKFIPTACPQIGSQHFGQNWMSLCRDAVIDKRAACNQDFWMTFQQFRKLPDDRLLYLFSY